MYVLYVSYEQQHGDPGRVQCVYERAIVDNALNVNTWIQYTAYLVSFKYMNPLIIHFDVYNMFPFAAWPFVVQFFHFSAFECKLHLP